MRPRGLACGMWEIKAKSLFSCVVTCPTNLLGEITSNRLWTSLSWRAVNAKYIYLTRVSIAGSHYESVVMSTSPVITEHVDRSPVQTINAPYHLQPLLLQCTGIGHWFKPRQRRAIFCSYCSRVSALVAGWNYVESFSKTTIAKR